MFYVWIEGLEGRDSMTLYTELQRAIDVAVRFENEGYNVQVRNANTGRLAYP